MFNNVKKREKDRNSGNKEGEGGKIRRKGWKE